VWLDGYILDALCALGLRHGHPDNVDVAGIMRQLTARIAMRELEVRSLWMGGFRSRRAAQGTSGPGR